jgi:molecular chaperone DnaJ
VSEAFDVLSDPKKRQVYDQGGMEGLRGTGFEGFQSSEEIFSHFGDIFADLFGDRFQRARAQPRRGRDLRFRLAIPFREAALGGEREVRVPMVEACSSCGGTGAAGGKSADPCPSCRGSGQATRQGRRQGGFFTVTSPCPECGGTGRRAQTPCPSCGGEGRTARESQIALRIPPGVESGQVLRIAGKGEAGAGGGPPGDLLFELEVEPHPEFSRTGKDIRSDIEVPVAVALLGGKVEAPALRGTVVLTVPPGTSSDAVLRIRGQGVPGSGGPGDHLFRVIITVPRRLTPEAERAIREHLAPADG